MAKDFRLVDQESLRTMICEKASATVIEAGDFVALDTGLIVKAISTSAAIGYAPYGAAAGVTDVDVTIGNDFVLEGTGDAVFAVTMKGSEVDLVGTTNLLIDVGASSTDVLRIDASKNAGTVDSTENIRVRINKPLF